MECFLDFNKELRDSSLLCGKEDIADLLSKHMKISKIQSLYVITRLLKDTEPVSTVFNETITVPKKHMEC